MTALIILGWWLSGFISILILIKIENREVLVKDLFVLLVIGVVGPLLFVFAFCCIIHFIIKNYNKINGFLNKRLF